MALPAVSVIIPTYNRPKCLSRAVASVEDQDYQGPIEILVVDDCSTQGIAIPELLNPTPKGPRKLRYLRTAVNSGCPAAPRNIGLKQATGKYLAFLDDDDLFFPTKIREQLTFMEETKAEASCTEGYLDDKLYFTDVYPGFVEQIFGKPGLPTLLTVEHLETHNWVITSTFMVTKAVADQVGLFVKGKENRFKWEDWHYWYRCAEAAKGIAYLPLPLTRYTTAEPIKWHHQKSS